MINCCSTSTQFFHLMLNSCLIILLNKAEIKEKFHCGLEKQKEKNRERISRLLQKCLVWKSPVCARKKPLEHLPVFKWGSAWMIISTHHTLCSLLLFSVIRASQLTKLSQPWCESLRFTLWIPEKERSAESLHERLRMRGPPVYALSVWRPLLGKIGIVLYYAQTLPGSPG